MGVVGGKYCDCNLSISKDRSVNIKDSPLFPVSLNVDCCGISSGCKGSLDNNSDNMFDWIEDVNADVMLYWMWPSPAALYVFCGPYFSRFRQFRRALISSCYISV